MVYDTLHEGALMFGGGWAAFAPINDFWLWNGDSGQWSEISREDAAVPWPGARSGHAMAWDQARNVLVLFGGGSAQNPRRSPTPGNGMGRRPCGRTAPSRRSPGARAGHTMYYDAGRQRTVLFGGSGETGEDAELWEWNGDAGTWTKINLPTFAAGLPRARYDHAMVFDSDRNTGLLFGGGWIDHSTGATVRSPTCGNGMAGPRRSWTSRRRIVPAATWPPSRTSPAMVYDTDRKRLVLIGGFPDLSANPIESIRAPVWEASWGPSTDAPAGGGCGCAAAASGGPSPGVVLLMLLAIGFRSRRARGARAGLRRAGFRVLDRRRRAPRDSR